ncbi:MAG TPA: LPS export ABC transporter permease LptG [Xanthomonadaceae bacterium]|nr:LPS export ABC transporter permease LptG [Xanthomonadaceae bacterium]
MRAWAFPKVHDLYIGRVVLVTVLLTWAVLLGLDVVLALFSEMADIGKGNYGFPQAVAYVGFTAPRRAYTLFPTAAVIGALMGLGQLAATSELTALRALGLSRRRLSLAAAAALALLTALMVFSSETIGPWGNRQADSIKASSISNDLIVAQYSGLWAREGDIFLNAQTGRERVEDGERWLELRDVRLYEFDDDGRLLSIARASQAEHRDDGWLLRDVVRTTFGDDTVQRSTSPSETWESHLDDTALLAGVTRPRYLRSDELRKSIAYYQRNGLDAAEFEEIYWARWFYPLNVLALCLAAIPFAFGTLRSGGTGKRLFLGIVFALGFWMLQEQFVKLASVYDFDYRIAFLVPPAAMLGISALLFRRRSG